MLDEYKLFPGLGVHWLDFGSGGRESRPDAGGVIRHYVHCTGQADRHVKTFGNTFFALKSNWPHNFKYRCALITLLLRRLVSNGTDPLHAGCRVINADVGVDKG